MATWNKTERPYEDGTIVPMQTFLYFLYAEVAFIELIKLWESSVLKKSNI